MSRTINKDEALNILKVAYLSRDLRMPNKKISECLGISPPTVTRRLAAARKRGWLQEILKVPDEFRDMRRFFPNPMLEMELLRRFHGQLDKVTIVPSGEEREISREHVVEATARLLEKELDAGEHILAVNWGKANKMISEALRPTDKKRDKLSVIPIFGDLGLFRDDPNYQESITFFANTIAYLFAQKMKAPEPTRISFPGIMPAPFFDKSNDDADLNPKDIDRFLDRFLMCDRSYQEIFLEETGLIYQADTLVSSIGALDESGTWYQYAGILDRSSREAAESEFELLKNCGVIGDIAQHFYTFVTKEGPVGKRDEKIERINKRVIALKPDHLIHVATKHRESQKKHGLGVVIPIAGKHKAEICITAIRINAVNHLLCDEELGKEIIKILDSEDVTE